MRVLVTGGAGYIGTELVRRLAAREDDEVIVYDNLSRRAHGLFLGPGVGPGRVRFIRGDLLDSWRLERALTGVDAVVHCAARVTTPFAEGDPHALEQVNHWGTAELGARCLDAGVPRLVYVSSTAVYGTSDAPATVTSAPQPATAYGLSKLRGEEALARYGARGDLRVLRCANVYGYSLALRFDAVVNRMLFEAWSEGRVHVEGAGDQTRAFTSVARAAAALEALARGAGPPGVSVLVDRNLSVEEIAQAITGLLPGTERLAVARDLPRRSLRVAPDPRWSPEGDLGLDGFSEELGEFLGHFAWPPAR
jgi:UDP-glucose 4-epimerase